VRTVRTVAELLELLAPERRAGRRIGLVPTMGFFHDGHLSLMRRAREESDVVVVSLFVNPAQFAPGEDFSAYPRDEQRDAELAEADGVDVLFSPPVEEVYPDGFGTAVTVGGLTEMLEGDEAQRGAEHFRGVTTVVTKLFNMVGPDVAYFGQKDAQQAEVVRRMIRDLALEIELCVLPTVRAPNGLALSSRNVLLSPEERERALALPRALATGNAEAARAALAASNGLVVDYIEVADFDPPVLAGAIRVGSTRLIDNVPLDMGSDPTGLTPSKEGDAA
jgi:pantoate--beta-alanine ligase